MSSDLSTLYDAPPAPLEIFTTKKIAPENQALLLQQRLEVFKPLGRMERRRLATRANGLRKRLLKAHYNDLILEHHRCWEEYQTAARDYVALREAVKGCAEQLASEYPIVIDLTMRIAPNLIVGLMPDLRRITEYERLLVGLVFLVLPVLLPQYKQARSRAAGLQAIGRPQKAMLAQLAPVYQQYREAMDRIEASDKYLKLRREQLEDEKKFVQEVKHLARLLRNSFANTPGCHHVYHDRRGKRHLQIPRLGRPIVMQDAIWFPLEASRKGIIGWSHLLPYGVIMETLTSEKSLDNYSVACGRQVEVRRDKSNTKIYFVVNRLDSPDGLPRKFYYRQMFDYYPEADHALLPWPVGVTENRKTLWKNFDELPHILIAGSSQSGKSNLVNCIISNIVQMNSPDEARLLLIDCKYGVEFTHYRAIPHKLGDIIKTVDDVLPALQKVIKLMFRRLAQLEAAQQKKFSAYNSAVSELPWPRIVVFIDELATILDQGQLTKDIHGAIRQLTNMGRAVGIHMVLCTQYSNIDVLPGSIKANLAVRISGAMPSGSASMTVLDSYDAKKLERIPGRMMIAIGSEMIKVQTPFISDADIAEAVAAGVRYGPALDLFADLGKEVDEEETQDMKILGKPSFTEIDLLDIAMGRFQGALKVRPIFDLVKLDKLASLSQIEKLVAQIVDKEQVEYEGELYQPVKQKGNFYQLQLIETAVGIGA